jgi:hypothetical protein
MSVRRVSSLALVVAVPLAAASSCLLPSYERVPASDDGPVGGVAGSLSGAGGSNTGGGAPGGRASDGGEAGVPAGSGGTAGGGATFRVEKQYAVEQGTNLSVSSNDGLFVYSGAGARDWTNVRSFGRDTSLPSNVATLDIDAADGSFTFEPSAEFFGVYRATYLLENAAGETATGELSVTVQPVAVDLGVVESGIGGFTVSGQSAEGIGRAVSAAGDLDGDGFDDFLVGAPAAAGGAGRVYVVFGAPGHDSFELDPTPGAGARHTVLAGSGSEALGSSVAPAGDLDGDGRGDCVIGAPGELGAANGRAYVVFGRERGELSGAIRDVVSASGFVLTRAGNENVGTLVAGGHDLTGDDTPDLVVFAGSSRTFYVVDGTWSADVDLETESEHELRGATAVDAASWRSLALVGDASGDGTGELVVGTGLVTAVLAGPAAGFPATLAPSTFLPEHGALLENAPPLGFVAVGEAADFDDDGAPDSVVCHARHVASDRCRLFLGMPAASTEGVSVTGFGGGDIRVAGGGDTSGDGIPDLLFSETAAGTSRAWVLFGRSRPASSLTVQNPGNRGFSLTGGALIEAVALGGDIDGPARDGSSAEDWLVGDSGAAGGNGRVTVVFGGKYSR